MPKASRKPWPWCLVLAAAAAVLCLAGCVAGEPLPVIDKPAPRPQLQTNLRPGVGVGVGVGGRVPAPGSWQSPPTRASASPTSPYGAFGGNKQLSYQRTPSSGSSGYGSGYDSRSPLISPPFRTSAAVFYPQRPRPGVRLNYNSVFTTSSKPKPTEKPKPKPCDCNCLPRPRIDVCGQEPGGSDRQTFINECQLGCHNCTMKKNYQVIAEVACEKLP